MLRDRPRRCPPPRAHRRSNTAARAAASEFVRARETACRGPPSRWEGRTPMRAWPDATKRVCPPRAALPDRSAPLLPSAFIRHGTRVEVGTWFRGRRGRRRRRRRTLKAATTFRRLGPPRALRRRRAARGEEALDVVDRLGAH